MAEKCAKTPSAGTRPVSMKLFATWEVDRTPSNCVPRVCSMNLTKLVLTKPLGSDTSSSLTIAVKMQGSKRTLRTNELNLNGSLEMELQMNFCLQYPHFLKRDVNKLHVMLQRRKKYKNRTILGYKTLAEGVINMSLVLQRPLDLELELLSDVKDPKSLFGRVTIMCLNSQPFNDHEDSTKPATGRGQDFSDEDEEFSSGEEASDSDPTLEERRRKKNITTGNARQRNLKQKFIALLKRFRVNEDLHALDNDRETISQKLSGGDMDPADIEDLFEELEDLSDSGPDLDTLSILSTPKPSLRPFFSSSRTNMIHEGLSGRHSHKKSHTTSFPPYNRTKGVPTVERNIERFSDESSRKADSDSYLDTWTDSDPTPMNSSPPKTGNNDEKKETPGTVEKEKEKKSRIFTRDRTSSSNKYKKSQMPKSINDDHGRGINTSNSGSLIPGENTCSMAEPRKALMEQLPKVLPPEDKLPEVLCLVHYADSLGGQLASKLQNYQFKVITPAGLADVRATFMCIFNKIQKYLNSNPKPPSQMKILLAGSDSFVNYVLRQYVEQLSFKPPDWMNYIKFYIIPLGVNTLSRYLGTVDSYYGTTFLFKEDFWKEQLECGNGEDIIGKIQNYLMEASNTIQLQIAEAMLSYKEKSSDDEALQIFIPFVNDVRICSGDTASGSNDTDDQSSIIIDRKSILDKTTPPNSPNIGMQYLPQLGLKQNNWELCEPLELQLDYWLVPNANKEISRGNDPNSKRIDTKFTLKTGFKSLHISRLFLTNEEPLAFFTVSYIKEKKQKIMRLGKKKEKEKDMEPKNQVIDSVLRLICSPKTQHCPLTITIDGYEWSGVKFFQLSSQWQTHIKHFPVAVYSLDYQPTSLPHLNHGI